MWLYASMRIGTKTVVVSQLGRVAPAGIDGSIASSSRGFEQKMSPSPYSKIPIVDRGLLASKTRSRVTTDFPCLHNINLTTVYVPLYLSPSIYRVPTAPCAEPRLDADNGLNPTPSDLCHRGYRRGYTTPTAASRPDTSHIRKMEPR